MTGFADVRYDMPKEELLKELGKPTSTLKHPGSGREVLNYPKGVRIEIEKGVVVSIKGLDMNAVEAATKAAAEKKAEEEAAAKLEAETQEKIRAVEAAAAAKTAPPATPAAPGEVKTYTMQQAVAAMEQRDARTGHTEHLEREYDDPAQHFSALKFLLGQVVWWVLMVIALKLTTMYRDMDIEWPGLLIAAAADTGTRMVLALIAWFVLHTTTFFYLNQLIATGVLLLVLRKVSLNQTWQKAARVAFGVKLFMLALRYIVEKVFHFAV